MREYEAWLANWITATDDEVAEQLAKPLPDDEALALGRVELARQRMEDAPTHKWLIVGDRTIDQGLET